MWGGALGKAGIEFIAENRGSGVRLRKVQQWAVLRLATFVGFENSRASGASAQRTLPRMGYGIRSPSFSKGFRLQPLGGESRFSCLKSAVSGGNKPPQAGSLTP
jgi:hypothetical protein